MNYQELQSLNITNVKKLRNISNRISFIRLFFFIVVLIAIYLIFKNGYQIIYVLGGTASLFLFLYFVNFHQKLIEKILYNETLISTCQNEILAEEGIYSQFDSGIDYDDREHSFSLDLDVFGKNSIFQLLNRTFTQAGRNKLANQLKSPLLSKSDIVLKQNAVQEVKGKIEWRINFIANGKLLKENPTQFASLVAWLSDDKFDFFSKFKPLLWLVPILNIFLIFILLFDVITYKVWLILVILQTIYVVFNRKRINLLYQTISKYTYNLEQYSKLFVLIENEEFASPLIKKWKEILYTDEHTSKKIQRLVNINKYFGLRNTPFAPILNIFFLWDYQCAYLFEVWKRKNSQSILKSFDILHEFESLVGISCYSYANIEYITPQVSETIVLNSSKLGHPLLNKKSNIHNNFQIENKKQIFIVTGANMAGKSTFLRTIGTNLILAMIGAPVCAEKFIFRPMQVFTCMRISDSIEQGESYFHAELTRLSRIIKLLENNESVFILLDELLKGTNSKDKLLGSELFLKKLLQYQSVYGMVATHDLDLTKMADTFSSSIKNICFEITIINDKMTFDYKLREGVTQNMNAIFLMNQMQII